MNAPADDVVTNLMSDLTLTRAMLDGAYQLLNTSSHVDGDDSLCHARTLLGECHNRLEATYTTIDVAGRVALEQGAV